MLYMKNGYAVLVPISDLASSLGILVDAYLPSKNHRDPFLVLLGNNDFDRWGDKAFRGHLQKITNGQCHGYGASKLQCKHGNDGKPDPVERRNRLVELEIEKQMEAHM